MTDRNTLQESTTSRRRIGRLWQQIKNHPLARVGPGLIAGVADDDPSGIATYSQAGAQFGFNMLWTMPLCYPLMSAVQLMCAQIGRVTGKGLAANIKAAFPPAVLRVVWPQFTLNATSATVIVGVFGTTISPYLFFWQASEEVEDMQRGHGTALLRAEADVGRGELRRMRWDTWFGMFYSDISA